MAVVATMPTVVVFTAVGAMAKVIGLGDGRRGVVLHFQHGAAHGVADEHVGLGVVVVVVVLVLRGLRDGAPVGRVSTDFTVPANSGCRAGLPTAIWAL